MRKKGYLIFHLNLAFSSIEESSRSIVVKKCYTPLLDLIENTKVPIGIELSGWTLNKIREIDNNWIVRFKKLLKLKKCELIGSGYSQIIGPLIPYKINYCNQKTGLELYKDLLNYRPSLALVNEMAFSEGLISLYNKFRYKGIILDQNNVSLVSKNLKKITHVEDTNKESIPILWSNSILFQKFQQYVFGDISFINYLDYINLSQNKNLIFPIYCNDAEIFDYRPGRFKQERPIHKEGEWNRIKKLLIELKNKKNFDIILPSKALEIHLNSKKKFVSKFTDLANPIIVKKQPKYNISRWAVTGRDSLWLNTMCHLISKNIINSNFSNQNDLKKICEFWSSDLRTHITESRWIKANKEIKDFVKDKNININQKIIDNDYKFFIKKNELGDIKKAKIVFNEDKTLLHISNKYLKLNLNLKRGLAIQDLAFASHKMLPYIGTIPIGHFKSIYLGADYYSGNLLIELPMQRMRITDLNTIKPKFFICNNGKINIQTIIKTEIGDIKKTINFSNETEKISIQYNLSRLKKFFGVLRLGNITFLNNFCNNDAELICLNGGKSQEKFKFIKNFDHSKSSSTLVSSTTGLGATDGKIQIQNLNKNIFLRWNNTLSAVMPMVCNLKYKTEKLSRIYFTMRELDESVKDQSALRNNFELNISTK